MTACKVWFFFLLITAAGISSCSKDKSESAPRQSGPLLNPAPLPASLQGVSATFYPDVFYQNSARTTFDLLLPPGDTAVPLVVYIHGGGFTGGDKDQVYDDAVMTTLIEALLHENTAFATINYRLLQSPDQEGVLKCLGDSKRALQYIRYYADALRIDPERIVLIGSSAGAGTALWLATHDDLAEPGSTDPVLTQSTRVSGAVCLETQATYDILSWPETVFSEYLDQGMDEEYIIQLGTAEALTSFYGVSSLKALGTPAVTEYRHQVDMLSQLSPDDPELFLSSTNQPYTFPESLEQLNHHPLQANAVLQRSLAEGVTVQAAIPAMGINTTTENYAAFLLRKLH